MFGLIKGFYDHYFSKPTYKILIIGLDNSGKTVRFFVDGLVDFWGLDVFELVEEIE